MSIAYAPRIRYSPDFETAGPLTEGLREIVRHLPARFTEDADGHRITFRCQAEVGGYRIRKEKDQTEITYSHPAHAFRALAVATRKGIDVGVVEEGLPFTGLGVMLDVSRNAVYTVEAIKRILRHLALMGYNTMLLYMEDTYEIEGEPFFGYFRGRYSERELKEIDGYAALFGIEVIPCIQTLGHLEQILQWPAYGELVDSPGVLLVGEERTYRLVGKMLDTLSSTFRSRRIHIGMDEAHGVALGRYRQLHGERRPFDVLNEHLQKVAKLCEERGLQPMIWSDMYFRLGSRHNNYYDKESNIPPSVAQGIPSNVELVYWDYYHDDPAFYADFIERHRRNLGKEPVFAAGAWTWSRMWTHYGLVEVTVSAGMKSARQAGLKQAFLTIWGDDGNECDPYSMFYAMQYFAEAAYRDEVDRDEFARNFESTCGENVEWIRLGGELDIDETLAPLNDNYANFGRWILWHDPVLNFLEKMIPAGLPEHYRSLVQKLRGYCPNPKAAIHHRFAIRLAETLALKSRLHLEVRPAYRNGDRKMLEELLELLPKLLESLRQLQEVHHTIWMEWRKPFGWDTIERRYAGVIARLESLQNLMRRHVENPAVRIPELDEEPLMLDGVKQLAHPVFSYTRVASASTIP